MRLCRHFINLCIHTAVAMVRAAGGLHQVKQGVRHGGQNGAKARLKDRVANQGSDVIWF